MNMAVVYTKLYWSKLFPIFFNLFIDNAYDPDVNASQLFIDVRLSNGQYSLVFTDNGSGMFPDQLYKMVR